MIKGMLNFFVPLAPVFMILSVLYNAVNVDGIMCDAIFLHCDIRFCVQAALQSVHVAQLIFVLREHVYPLRCLFMCV